jgi:phosphonate transport system permease protein
MRKLDPASQVFRRRNLVFALSLVAALLVTYGSSLATSFSFSDGVLSFPAAFSWMAQNFVPDARAWKSLPKILDKLWETVLVSVMASTVGAILAYALAILASRATRPHAIASAIVRLFASLCRNIPVVAWAMILLLSFGQNVLTGFISLLIGTVGFLTRAFVETIDEAAESGVEALRATGAPWLAIVTQAVTPSVMPQVISWTLYMVETNVRDATLVGILTGTGIGFVFDLAYKAMKYPTAALVVSAIVVVVILIEMGSNALRKAIA